MLIYWLLLLIPILALFSPYRATLELSRLNWFLFGLFLVLVIGLRHQVGGDWTAYLNEYEDKLNTPFKEIFVGKEPLQSIMVWVCALFGTGVYGPNTVSAAIFVAGLIYFCRRQDIPWLAAAVAVPYLVIVVSMGYTRQSLAIGLLLFAIPQIERGHLLRYLVLMTTAVLFHYGAVFLLPVGMLIHSKRGLFKAFAAVGIMGGAIFALLQAQLEFLYAGYIEQSAESGGGVVRVLMCALAGAAYFLVRKRWENRWSDGRIWQWFALLSLACLPLVFIASTAVDRVALYFIPLQLAVFSRLPVLVTNQLRATTLTLGTLAGYFLVEFIWLNFGSHSFRWLPYQNIFLLMEGIG